MKPRTAVSSDSMRAEYHFDYAKAVRGKYHRRSAEARAEYAARQSFPEMILENLFRVA